MTEADAPDDSLPFAIRSAMRDSARHLRQQPCIDGTPAQIDDTDDSTHASLTDPTVQPRTEFDDNRATAHQLETSLTIADAAGTGVRHMESTRTNPWRTPHG